MLFGKKPTLGKQAPDFTLPSAVKENVSLSEGGVVRYAHRGVTPDDRPSLLELMAAGINVAKMELNHVK